MKNLSKIALTFLFLSILGNNYYGQNSPNLNALKFDLIGLPLIAITNYESKRWRSSIEYERFLSKEVPVSIVLDFEVQARRYSFARYFSWPNDYLLETEWWPAITNQLNFSTVLGLRYSSPSVFTSVNRVLWFLEPRFECALRKAKLFPDSVSRPSLTIHQLTFSPRLRTGFWYRLGGNWAFEASVDIQKFKFIGDGHHKWGAVGEINAVFTF